MDEAKNWVFILCAIATLAIQFWKLRKPVETKIAILWWLAQLSCLAAVILAAYILMWSDNIEWALACASYNFFVQATLFALSASSATRGDILLIVFAAVLLVNVPTYLLFRTQAEIINMESRMVELHDDTASIRKKLLTPTPSPPPSPLPHTP